MSLTGGAGNNSDQVTSRDSVVSLIEEGNALEEQGRPSEAMKCYEAAVQADPRCARAHLNRGNMLLASARIDEARNAYQLAVACDPRYAAAYFNLANLNCRSGEYEQALRNYGIAIRIKPDFADAFVALGNALADLGRTAEARESYQRALAISGDDAGPVPRAFVTSLFDDYASRFDTHLVDALGYSLPKSMREAAGRIIPNDRRFQHALDLGCGTGLIGAHFRDVVAEIDGVDLSPKMLEQARRKHIYNKLDCDEIVAWLERSATESLSFDIVLAADVFVYVGNLERAFNAIRTILADGGLFVFSVEHLSQGSFELLPTFRYAHSASYVRDLAPKHGFIIELSEQVNLRKERNAMIGGTIFVLTRP
jgi:predicted TPR repeat methyltransferase